MKEVSDGEGAVADMTPGASRRQLLTGGVAAGLAAAGAAVSVPTAAYSATVDDIPELAPQWKKLDLAEILKLPAAYVSISQSKSLYDAGGAQSGEKHRERGSLEATIKVVDAARKAKNFISFNWIGYSIFRQHYPQSIFDKVQYESWVAQLVAGEDRLGRRDRRGTTGQVPARRQPPVREGAADRLCRHRSPAGAGAQAGPGDRAHRHPP